MSSSLNNTLLTTDYQFEGQTGVYHGKVRDVYTIKDKYLAIIATDRISAFDVILPRAIPYKGQVLNQTAAYFLKATKDIISNWLISTPDENASFGYRCEPIKVEVVVRGMLVGHAWREYKSGKRILCGVPLPDGLQEFDLFSQPIITPTTKAAAGHDEDISAEEIVRSGLVETKLWDKLSEVALKLFTRGQEMAKDKNLILADTKYEFGLLNGELVLMDEIHTPDSSRYFYLEGHSKYTQDRNGEPPKHLSKEFARSWLMENGFSGQSGQEVPEMTDEIVKSISERYIELYEQLTGQKFVKADNTDIVKRIETNTNNTIRSLN